MSSRYPERRAALCAVAGILVLAGCEREQRRFREAPPGATATPLVVMNDENQPGTRIVDPDARITYQQNAWAISEGQILFAQFNCAGCHAPGGGGGMGPSLIDSLWIYGSAPENIFATIVEGRPRGMPSFRGRIGNAEVWKLTAYVRALSALTPQDTRPGRTDDMHGIAPDPMVDPMIPMSRRIPEESKP